MPFLAPVAAWVGSVITGISAWAAASPILAGIAQTAFGIAAKYAASRLTAKKPKATSSRLETEYGADLTRFVGMGVYAYAGNHVFRNTYGKGNTNVQDVYVLSHFNINKVRRVKVLGEWITVEDKPYNANTGYALTDRVAIKIYLGSMAQTADAFLISKSQGRWTSDMRGAGVAYAIVTTFLNRESKYTSPIQPIFEIEGARLYDWRKDSTVGGSGLHRWNDQSTWEFTENGVQMMYALERGLFNGTQKMVGKGVHFSKLPLSEWSLAANIADELVVPEGGGPSVPRYRASVMAQSGSGSNHDSNMQPLLESMAGSWVERVDGEYPIAGAEQPIAFTITDGDLVREAGYRVSLKLPRSELINTVAIKFPSPESFYEMVPGTTRVDNAALVEDGEELASAITYESVIYSEQVDRLADIAIRAARYQGNAEITIHPKYLDLAKVGKWFTWNSVMYGTISWQIVSVTLGPLSDRGARNIRLGLREIAPGVFDRTAYVNDPPGPPVPIVPDFLAEVQNPGEVPNLVTGATGTTLPGVIFTWDAIDDLTVIEVEISYRPVDQPTKIFKKTVRSDITSVQVTEGLTSSTLWQWQTILITDPQRTVAASAWRNFMTLQGGMADIYPIDVTKLAQDLQDYLEWSGNTNREIWRQLEEIGTHFADQELNNYQERREIVISLSARTDQVEANYKQEILVATGPDSAIARSITTLNAAINNPATGLAANANAISGLQTRVSTAEGNISASALAINQVKASLAGFASANAVLSLEARVDNAQGSVANLIIQTTADYNSISATGTIRMQQTAAPAGWTSRIGIEARVGTADAFKQAGMFIDVTTTLSRIAFVTDQFIISDNVNYRNPFTFIGGVASLNVANIGTITAGIIQSPNGKMVINCNLGNIQIFS